MGAVASRGVRVLTTTSYALSIWCRGRPSGRPRIGEAGLKAGLYMETGTTLVGGKAVEQAVPERRAKRALAAAPGDVRRVPGRRTLTAAEAVVMTEHGAAVVVTRPGVAGGVEAIGRQRAVRIRSRQDVVAIAVDPVALLGQRGIDADPILVAVQLRHVGSDLETSGVAPRSLADAIARVDGGTARGRGRAQIRAPHPGPAADGLGQPLAMCVGPGKSTEVAAEPAAAAGDEEAHFRRDRRLVLRPSQQHRAGNQHDGATDSHRHAATIVRREDDMKNPARCTATPTPDDSGLLPTYFLL